MCLEISTQRDIAAQILRHRSFSFQEFSTRYARTAPAEIPAFRRQDDKNRQASHDDLDEYTTAGAERVASQVITTAYLAYQELLAQGVAKECARRILPLCTPTTLYMTGTIRSWIHYCQLRTNPDTQLEHRQIANQAQKILHSHIPSLI